MISTEAFGTKSKSRGGKSGVLLLLGTCQIFSGWPDFIKQMWFWDTWIFPHLTVFIRSSNACIKIQAKSSRNVYVPPNEFSVWNGGSTPYALYDFSFYSHIWTTLNRQSLRYILRALTKFFLSWVSKTIVLAQLKKMATCPSLVL